MKNFIMGSFLFLFLAVTSGARLTVRQANISKLIDPKTRFAETERLRGDKGDSWQLDGVRFIECPQKDGKPLYLLMTKQSYISSIENYPRLNTEYSKKEAEDLFKKEVIETDPKTGMNLPNGEVINGWAISFFRADGTEVHPFGGNNYISRGYVVDVNNDGVLECIESTNWDIKAGYSTKTLSVKTIEEESNKLLHVLFEWHPDSADVSNEWVYSVTDNDSDGYREVNFGPEGEKPQISYRWDADKKDFLGPEGKYGDHYKRLNGKSLEAIKQSGGLGYELQKSERESPMNTKPLASDLKPVKRQEIMARKPHPLRDFKSMSFEQTMAFFTKGRVAYHKDENMIPTVFPEALKTKPSKEAALAYVKANRSDKTRRSFALALDDRNGVKPPDSGWMVFKQNSAASYFYLTWCWAVNIEKNLLVYITSSSDGGHWRNPLVDETGYTIRILKLKPMETKRIVGTLWWLNQVRSKRLTDFGNMESMSTSADGSCSLYHTTGAVVTSYYDDLCCWMGYNSFHARWKDDYDKEVSANFASHYLEDYLPTLLGKRWIGTTDLEAKNLSEEEKAEQSKDEVKKLSLQIAKILEINKETPFPAEVLASACRIAGDLGMTVFLPEVKRLKNAAKPAGILSKKIETLAEELRGKEEPFIPKKGSEEAALKEKFETLRQLRLERSQNADWVLNQMLERPIKQLSALGDAEKLLLLSISKDREANWAQRQLRYRFPSEHALSLAQVFKKAADPNKRQKTLDLLISLYPETALDLVLQLKEHEKEAVCINILPLYKKLIPKQVDELLPMILKKAANPEGGWQQHSAVASLIPENFPNDEAEIYPQLLIIAKASIAKNSAIYNQLPHTEAILSLTKWPRSKSQWKDIFALAEPNLGTYDYQQIERRFIELSREIGGEARAQLIKRLEAGLMNSGGLMRGRINAVFENDFREILPMIERLATASPQERQHERANMSQGNSFPTGRFSYHAARYVRALWADHDAETRAKVWAAQALRAPSLFIREEDPYTENTVWELTLAGEHLVQYLKQSPEMMGAFLERVDGDQANGETNLAKLAERMR